MKQLYSFFLLLLLSCQFTFAQAEGEKATVYFTLPGFLESTTMEVYLFNEGGYLGKLRQNKTIKAEMEPGEQKICGILWNDKFVNTLSLKLEPGKTYYVAGKSGNADQFLFDVTNDSKLLKKAKKKIKKEKFIVVSPEEKQKYEAKFEDRWVHILKEDEEIDNSVQIARAQEAAGQAAKVTSPEDMVTVHVAHVGLVADHIELPVFHGTKYIGSIKGKNTITYKAPPGYLSFTGVYSEVNFASAVNIAAQPGATYYLQADLNGGAYKMEASPDGQLTHFFLTNVTGDQEKQNAIKKLVNKKSSISFSEARKAELESAYGELVQNTATHSVGKLDYVADATAGPSTGTFTNTSTVPNATVDYSSANKREIALQEILKTREAGGAYTSTTTTTGESSVIQEEGKIEKVKNSEDNTEADLKYRRSSLYTMMINDTDRLHFDVIRDAFGNFELSEKFNDHNIGPYLIDAEGGEKDQSDVITAYLNENGVARDLVARWFNRNEKGEFSMDLVAERGSYNASDLDVLVAKDSKRGEALLADAGEELIGNTFLIVNDYKYVNKEEVAEKASGVLSFVSDVASAAGYDGVALAATAVNVGTSVMGKGYVVKTTSYLYRLEWNEEVANEFYSNLWMDSRNYDPAKKEAFENSDLFKLRLVGSQSAWADLQSTAFTKKSDEELISNATVKATNKGISKLQRKFEEFRTKSPLLSGDPITAKIGLKEGLEKGDKFEVLEQVIDKDGRTRYKRVGKIKVDHKHIWDNTLYDEESEETSSTGEEYTVFKGRKGKYYSGMLIRQIN